MEKKQEKKKKSIFKHWWFWIVVIILMSKSTAGQSSTAPVESKKYTYDKFMKVSMGMTYDQVKEILGEGQLISETELMGTKDQMYEWINSDGANMNITFQNGKVDTKTQFELK